MIRWRLHNISGKDTIYIFNQVDTFEFSAHLIANLSERLRCVGPLTEFKRPLLVCNMLTSERVNQPNIGEEEIEMINFMYLFHETSYILQKLCSIMFDDDIQVNPVLPTSKKCLLVLSSTMIDN